MANCCDRFLQTVCVFLAVNTVYFTLFFGIFILIGLCFSIYTFWIPLFYLIWYIYDFNTSEKGGRYSKRFRSIKFWDYCRDYFEASLIKTADLDPSKNYLICAHPHGILPYGCWINFCTESTSFSEKYPGIKPHLLAMSASPRVPIWREIFISVGGLSCSEKSIKCILSNNGPGCKEKGQAPVLLVGGISEQYLTTPKQYSIYLNNRKGFVRVALETGTSLVPAFCFGENEIFKTVSLESCFIKSLEWIFKNICCNARFRAPIFRGRFFTLLPFRKKLTMVIGKPIEVLKVEKPTDEQIKELHEMYVSELTNLYNNYKQQYLEDEANTTFLIV